MYVTPLETLKGQKRSAVHVDRRLAARASADSGTSWKSLVLLWWILVDVCDQFLVRAGRNCVKTEKNHQNKEQNLQICKFFDSRLSNIKKCKNSALEGLLRSDPIVLSLLQLEEKELCCDCE